MGIKFIVFLIAGQYDGWWTYVTFGDLIALVRYSLAATFFIAAGQYFLGLGFYIPRYVIVMDCLGGDRRARRACAARGGCIASSSGRSSIPATSAGPCWWAPTTPRACWPTRSRPIANCPTAFAAFWPWKTASVGSRLGQIPILGRLEDVREVAAACAASTVLVTAGTLAGSRLRNLMDACKESGLELKIIRPIQDRLGGDHRIPIRDIEISDLFAAHRCSWT